MPSETIEGKRYYTTPDGIRLPSVTTQLSRLSHEGIDDWRNKIGLEEAQKITTQAARRGSAVHSICEKYIRNEQNFTQGAMPANIASFAQIRKFLDAHVNNIRAIEYPLFSYDLGTAGRTDLIAEFDGKDAIIDFKTSRKPKKEEWIKSYFMQGTSYALMANKRININIEDIVILVAVDHEEIQIFHKKVKDYKQETLDFFRFNKEL